MILAASSVARIYCLDRVACLGRVGCISFARAASVRHSYHGKVNQLGRLLVGLEVRCAEFEIAQAALAMTCIEKVRDLVNHAFARFKNAPSPHLTMVYFLTHGFHVT